MKNLSLNQQYTLFYKIQEIHDKIYKLPANRFIFSAMEINGEYTGMLPFYYEPFEDYRFIIYKNRKKIIKLIPFHDINKFKYNFNDQLIVYYYLFNHSNEIKIYFKNVNDNPYIAKHKGIFIECGYDYKEHVLNTVLDSLDIYNNTLEAANNEIIKRKMPKNIHFNKLFSFNNFK